MTFIENKQMIQTFLAHTAHPALGKGVGIRRPIRCENDFDAFRGKYGIKAGGKLCIPVVQQKSHRAPFFLELPHQVTSLLHDPGSYRFPSTAGKMNPAGAYFNEEQHIEGLQAHSFHGKEITGQELLLVLARDVHARCYGTENVGVKEEPCAVSTPLEWSSAQCDSQV